MISAGIGGGFPGRAPIGSLVVAEEMVAADLGAETPEGFVSLDKLGFGTARVHAHGSLVERVTEALRNAGLPVHTGPVLTVSTVTGTAATAAALSARIPGAAAEGMEGYGVAAAAVKFGIPVLEIRAISTRLAQGTVTRGESGTPECVRSSKYNPEGGSTMKIAFSPCPNDTFVFHAWVHGLLPGAPKLDVQYADIDITNNLAANGSGPEVLKISYAALPWAMSEYALLPCGGALGRGCGPLVLTKDGTNDPSILSGRRIAVPSERSTAYLLFRLWAAQQVPGGVGEIVVMPFHEIMPAVRDGSIDAGLVIHEARFTYVVRAFSSGRPGKLVGG